MFEGFYRDSVGRFHGLVAIKRLSPLLQHTIVNTDYGAALGVMLIVTFS